MYCQNIEHEWTSMWKKSLDTDFTPFISIYILYICFFLLLRWVFVAARGLSLVAASGGYSSLQCAGFSLQWLLLLWGMGSRRVGFSSCSTQDSVVVAHVLSCSAACGIFQDQDRTRVPCIGRRILNHCATREVPKDFSFFKKWSRNWHQQEGRCSRPSFPNEILKQQQ